MFSAAFFQYRIGMSLCNHIDTLEEVVQARADEFVVLVESALLRLDQSDVFQDGEVFGDCRDVCTYEFCKVTDAEFALRQGVND